MPNLTPQGVQSDWEDAELSEESRHPVQSVLSRHSLYQAGSIFPSPRLFAAENFGAGIQPSETVAENAGYAEIEHEKAVAVTPPKKLSVTKTKHALDARPDDSEAFCRLLERIAETPPEEWGVDETEMARLLERFRADMLCADGREADLSEEIASSLEAHYLVALRRKILPRDRPAAKKTRPALNDFEEDAEEDEAYFVAKNAGDFAENDFEERQAINLPRRRSGHPQSPARSQAAPEPASFASPPTPPPPVYPSLAQQDGGTHASQIVTTPHGRVHYDQASAPPAHTQPMYAQQTRQPGMAVVPVSYVNPTAAPIPQGTWEQHSRWAAELLRQQLDHSSSARTFANEAKLRLLELVNGHRGEAVKPFTEVDKPFNEYWGDQILGLSALMEEPGGPDDRSRYTMAAFRLDEGLMDLRRLCPIRLKNVRFAQDVWAFGDYLPRSEECHAGEKVDVYLELENPTVRRTAEGYNVSASLSYEIRSPSGSVLDKYADIGIQSSSPSRRRDYFAHLKVAIPEALSPGGYLLRISVTDLNDESLRFSEEQIPLTVLPKPIPEERAMKQAR